MNSFDSAIQREQGTDIEKLAHRLRMLKQKAIGVGLFYCVPEGQMTTLCPKIDCLDLLISS